MTDPKNLEIVLDALRASQPDEPGNDSESPEHETPDDRPLCARCWHPAHEHHVTDGCERVIWKTNYANFKFCRCEGYVAPGACRHCDGTGLVRELEDDYPLPSTTCPTCGGASP